MARPCHSPPDHPCDVGPRRGKPACAQFKWPLATEKSWFDTGKLEGLASGATVATLTEGTFTVTLKPATEVPFKLKPEGKPKADKPLGALFSFAAVKAPGRYQVTLSDEAWIDIVQADAYRPSLEFSGVHGCPARDRKSGHRFSVDHALSPRFRSRSSLQA